MLDQSLCNFAWLIEIYEIICIPTMCTYTRLKQEIINKKRRVRLFKKDSLSVKNELLFKLSWIHFHVYNLFSVGNEHVIYNFLSHILTEAEISALCRDLQFALPPKTLQYADYMVSFELVFQDIKITNLNTP